MRGRADKPRVEMVVLRLLELRSRVESIERVERLSTEGVWEMLERSNLGRRSCVHWAEEHEMPCQSQND